MDTVTNTQTDARYEAIRALLLSFMITAEPHCSAIRYATPEEMPCQEVLTAHIHELEFRKASMTPEAYFDLLTEFDLVAAHRLLFLDGKSA